MFSKTSQKQEKLAQDKLTPVWEENMCGDQNIFFWHNEKTCKIIHAVTKISLQNQVYNLNLDHRAADVTKYRAIVTQSIK